MRRVGWAGGRSGGTGVATPVSHVHGGHRNKQLCLELKGSQEEVRNFLKFTPKQCGPAWVVWKPQGPINQGASKKGHRDRFCAELSRQPQRPAKASADQPGQDGSDGVQGGSGGDRPSPNTSTINTDFTAPFPMTEDPFPLMGDKGVHCTHLGIAEHRCPCPSRTLNSPTAALNGD